MQLAIRPLKSAKGIKFFKLLGTGGGFGFSLKPDLRTYALLIVWENAEAAKNFTDSNAYLMFNRECKTNFTYWMGCVKSKGSWGGTNPFQETFEEVENPPIMVVTRARVKFSKIIRFLIHTKEASRSAQHAEGLIYTKGIGEWPAIEQATFSLWKDKKSMETFAYSSGHNAVIQKSRKENWYKEELFARFVPVELSNI